MGFGQPLDAGGNITRDFFRSPNYVTGVSGWTINRDGTAEFQDVVVRGSITADDFRSANYVPGTSGFDLNALTGVVELNSQVTVNGPFAVNGSTTITGPTSLTGAVDVFGTITLHSNTGFTQGVIQLIPDAPTGIYTAPGSLYAHTETTITGSPDATVLQSPADGVGNTTFMILLPKASTTPAEVLFGNGVNPVMVGDGGFGGVYSYMAPMRTQFARDITSHAGFIGTTYQNITTIAQSGILCPPSGVVMVTVSCTVVPTTVAAGNLIAVSVQVDNTTQGTTPHGPTDNDCAQVMSIVANGAITIERTIAVANCGLPGDLLTIQPMMKIIGTGSWTVQRIWQVVVPSP